jgi:hypothetical protein
MIKKTKKVSNTKQTKPVKGLSLKEIKASVVSKLKGKK